MVAAGDRHYIAGFLTIAIVWLNHNAMFRHVDKITHGMVVTNLLLLLVVALPPPPMEVPARFGPARIAVVGYGLVLGYFFPIVGVVTFALLSLAALLPQSIAIGMMGPEDKGEPAA